MSAETPDFTDEELEMLEGIILEETSPEFEATEVVEIPTSMKKIVKATDKECEEVVNSIMADYPGLVEPASHWLFTLISIVKEISYRPNRSLVCNIAEFDQIDKKNILALVQSHVSPELLQHIKTKVKEWVEENPLSLKMEGVEGAIIVREDGGLAYQAEEVVVEAKAASSGDPGWASW